MPVTAMSGRNPFEPLDGPVADTLDLHGMTAAEAVAAASAFVQRVQRRAPGSLVHLITGRGRGSPGRPVLKPKVKTLLKSGELPIDAWGEDLDGGGYLVRLHR
jgi:DNA-nicking Smr family endonuclease